MGFYDYIEIIEGFFAHEYTNIMPASADPQGLHSYLRKEDEMISIGHHHLLGFLGTLLNKYYCEEVQLEIGENYDPDMKYDIYGWNFYTASQIHSILSELEEFVKIAAIDPLDTRCVDYLSSEAKYRARIKPELTESERIDLIKQEAAVMVDFYSRFVLRMKRMLQNMDGYDLIVFVGP